MKHGFFSIKNFIQLVSNNQLVIILTVTFISPSGFKSTGLIQIMISPHFVEYSRILLCGKLLPSGYKTVTSKCRMIIIIKF